MSEKFMTLSIASPVLFRSILQRSRPELRFYIDAYAVDLLRTLLARPSAAARPHRIRRRWSARRENAATPHL